MNHGKYSYRERLRIGSVNDPIRFMPYLPELICQRLEFRNNLALEREEFEPFLTCRSQFSNKAPRELAALLFE